MILLLQRRRGYLKKVARRKLDEEHVKRVNQRRWALNRQQMYFARLLIEVGFRRAKELSGYGKVNAYRLLKDRRIMRYQMALIGEAMDDIKLGVSDIIREMWKMAKSKAVPEKLRYEILRDLVSMAKADYDTTDNVQKRIEGAHRMLKPSIEVPYEEIKDGKKESGGKEYAA